jgi:DnaK suppressor protein
MITEEQIKIASESDYMSEAQLEFFKQRLIDLHDNITARIDENKSLMASSPDLNDDNDRASWEEQNSISLRILEREQKMRPKIKQALRRIGLGDYGFCLETGEPIGIPRLLIRPTAEYSADVKALQEIKEKLYRG